MKTFIPLLKTNLNVNFGFSFLKHRFTKEKKRLWEPVAIFIAVVIGGGSLVTMYSLLLMEVFKVGQILGQPEIVLTLAFVASQLIILIFGIFYIISVFYFSNDMNLLIPLPLKQGEVLGAKFITILISEYLVALPMLLPALIVYGAGTDQGLVYWLKGLVLVLAAPVLPLVFAALFVVLLMRFVNIRKSKDLMMILGSLLGLTFGIGINFFSQNLPAGGEGEFIQDLIESNTGLIEAIGKRFPPSIWATLGLAKSGLQNWGYFFLFIGLSLLLVALLFWIGNHFFYKGFLSGQEVRKKGKAVTTEDMAKYLAKDSTPVFALFRREWKLFMRTPIFIMNGLAGMILFPVFLLMPFITKSEELGEIVNYAKDPAFSLIAVLISFGIMLFSSSMNMLSCTAISREGPNFWISKVIPVSPKYQVLAKLLHSGTLSLIGMTIITIPLYIFLGILPHRLIILIILGILANALINALGLIIDILRPKLQWNDPQEAIKQNLNVFFGLIASFIVMAVLAVISIFLVKRDIGEFWVYGALALTNILLLVPTLYGLFALADSRYKNIDV